VCVCYHGEMEEMKDALYLAEEVCVSVSVSVAVSVCACMCVSVCLSVTL